MKARNHHENDANQSIFLRDGHRYTHPFSKTTPFADISYGVAFNSAGNLFETDWGSGNIYEFTPGGVRSTFASGLSNLNGLAFNSVGDLFVVDDGGSIYEFTPGGVRSTFASGLSEPLGLAFNSAGNLFVGENNGSIDEFTPGGVRSTFASGLRDPVGLAFQSVTLPVPEPSVWAMLGMGVLTLLGLRRKSASGICATT